MQLDNTKMVRTVNEQDANSLQELRAKISTIDELIVRLLEMRVETAGIIGAIKKSYDLPIYCPGVEKEKIEYLSNGTKYEGMVETIWPVIMCYTRSCE